VYIYFLNNDICDRYYELSFLFERDPKNVCLMIYDFCPVHGATRDHGTIILDICYVLFCDFKDLFWVRIQSFVKYEFQ